MRGGAVQSIGMGLYEDLAHDEHGQLRAGSFLTYAVPRSDGCPPIETILVEVPSAYGPFGAGNRRERDRPRGGGDRQRDRRSDRHAVPNPSDHPATGVGGVDWRRRARVNG